ncbi:MAG: Vitamin K epoxide reductase [Deltaproteobacteria bacterium]|nr:Vitamin K epoxide reductase [Deltaproteobacteria bacterium]
MAKTSTSKTGSTAKAAAQSAAKQGPSWPIFVLALAGMTLSGYLTYSAWQGQSVAGCTVGSACDVVLNSRWSRLLGMPTSFWGFLTYALLAAIAWNKPTASQWKLAWIVTIGGFLYSLYLTGVSLIVLNSACPYCLTSLGLMTAIFAVLVTQRPARMPGFSWGPWLGKTGGAALLIIVGLHLHYSGYIGKTTGPEDPWVRGLVEHLVSTEAKFYGASWCPHCIEQKELFGATSRRVPYIECSPGGPRAPQATVCSEANIKSYPTWIINGERYTGTQSLDSLAQFSKYKPEGAKQ